MSRRVVIADYGIGNLLSVQRAFAHRGAEVTVSGDPAVVAAAERLVVPGVGAFGRCTQELRAQGLWEPVQAVARSGRPWLGICVGMQMMMDYSEEFGRHEGFGLIAGDVRAIPRSDVDGQPQKVPHIGWNRLAPAAGADWAGTILDGVSPDSAVYFVHSFAAAPSDPAAVLATAPYGGRPVVAAVRHGNAFGVQFHPEKSGAVGLAVIDAFLALPES